MPKKTAILTVWFILVAHSAAADIVGASDSVIILKLTSIYQAMKDYYNSNLKILAEAKVQSDKLKKLSEYSKEIQKEYNFVKDFSVQRELDMIEGDIRGLTNLNNLDGKKSPEEQIRIIRSEIDRRFKKSNDQKERDKYAQLKSRIENIERLNALKKAKTEEAKKHGTEKQSEKTSLASIASSCALISSLQMAQEQRNIEHGLAAEIKRNKNQELENQFVEALDKMR